MTLKLLRWMGSSKKDLEKFPRKIQKDMGYALFLAQEGNKHEHAKVLKGFGSAGILEVIEYDEAGTYRTIYTLKLEGIVYVLHAFQKKSKRNIETPLSEIELIKKRFKDVESLHKQSKKEQ
jgi:phage-related protein